MRARGWIGIAVLAIGGIVGVVWLASSVLFLRALVADPQKSHTVFIGGGHPALKGFVQPLQAFFMSDSAQAITDVVPRWIYQKREDDQEVVAAYTLGSDSNTISNPQWHIEDFKVASIFSSDSSASPQLSKQTLLNVMQYVADSVVGNMPFIHPSIVIDIPGEPGPIAVSGKVLKGGFEFVYSREESLDQLRPQRVTVPESINHMYVALPSDYLEIIPMDLQKELETIIKTDLYLTKSRPDIIPAIRQAGAFVLLEGEYEGEAALGVIEDTASFTELVSSWIALERGYLEPVKQSFRLPDGTIGREYIPSTEIGDGLSEPGLDRCSISYIGSRPVWVCRDGKIATLSTSNTLGYEAMSVLEKVQEGNWEVALPDPYATQLVDAMLRSTEGQAPQVSELWLEGDGIRGTGSIRF